MVFGKIKSVFGAGAKQIKAEYGENKDFLEAVCAASALVAAADGDISESERRKVVSIITNHSELSKIYQGNVIEQTAEKMFKLAKDRSGRQQLARELDDIKGRPNGPKMAEDAYLVACDIADADGEVSKEEEDVLKKIADRLGLDPSKFDF
ncbi:MULTISPECIES: tellurite resistance TerB family protein [unclassified Brucella]|uniref:tellurite resistance TerB family protein n=1 Tax=unclassified Brucella TaxID=2632610 RepID=UPI0012AE53A0|nr:MULTISPECIES: tellurite resistance TerB family protein [unclassified Brucella]MRN43436.1 TerB [Brucella sp. 09RB8913]MRN59410.1 TerB [Brucella sp. 09RB8918]MRN67998.1 TerB [Brucella sp. 10RB9213]